MFRDFSGFKGLGENGVPERIRTSDLRFRKPLLVKPEPFADNSSPSHGMAGLAQTTQWNDPPLDWRFEALGANA